MSRLTPLSRAMCQILTATQGSMALHSSLGWGRLEEILAAGWGCPPHTKTQHNTSPPHPSLKKFESREAPRCAQECLDQISRSGEI